MSLGKTDFLLIHDAEEKIHLFLDLLGLREQSQSHRNIKDVWRQADEAYHPFGIGE